MSVTRPPVPLDDALSAMPRMLDVDAMAPVLERSLGGAHSIDSVTIRYLRYKQGRSLLVRYEVGVAGAVHGVATDRKPAGGKEQLHVLLVHPDGRGEHPRADVGDAGQLEQALQRAVLAERTVDKDRKSVV